VREGVDRVITVRYDADTGASIVGDGDSVQPAEPERTLFDREPPSRRRDSEESVESGAGANV